ncbi:hypothetical protein BCR37DRAFT_1889 [Protomyces lactucae-debilis]|uniref:Uncharacterized protein n=1 Tax=Protomyces lactucae-debilis TaxID=2754530 RepID=A0A1Y2FVK9_PROLT|nr:uncharacterized protein BCR37DRAFT_1889 [Protomyces lactucae-debilis]ORY87597.1 hypothetical protein BCR37DRAFT_1889 [Protomyces lactucae-debilis]
MISPVKILRGLSAVAAVLCIVFLSYSIREPHQHPHIELREAIKLGSAKRPIVWQVDDLPETNIDPLNRLRAIEYVPFDGSVPQGVSVNESFNIHFTCLDNSLCPESFAALIVGPAQHAFISSPNASQVQKQHTLQIADPGTYKVYLWPHFGPKCSQYYNTPDPWYERLAVGSPFTLRVTGSYPVRVVDSPCSSIEAIQDGRWVHSADLHMSEIDMLGFDPYAKFIRHDHVQLAPYIWLPYTCHVKHRSIRSHLARLKAKHVLIMGDSVSRDPFCRQIYEPHVKNLTGGPCDIATIDNYHGGTKQLSIRYGGSPDEKTLLTFVRISDKFGADGKAPLKDEEARITPTHVIWNQGLWFQLFNASAEEEYETLTRTSRLLLSLYPDAKHIIRGTTSMHENIACYEQLSGRDACIRESNTARRVYEEERDRSPNALLAFMETFSYTDVRPETTKDGRHYTRILNGGDPGDQTIAELPRVGETDVWLVVLMFEIWARHI